MVAGVWVGTGARSDPGTAFAIPGETDPILVEVLNGTTVDDLARDVTWSLRRSGIDVVYYGSAAQSDAEMTRVIARRGDTVVAARVREILGLGQVADEPAPDLLLDVTVVLGRDAASAMRN